MKMPVITIFIVFVVCVGCDALPSRAAPRLSAASRRDGARNVHLVQHSHDDPGWLKTVDQYHYGSNNSIQVAGTQYILDSVVLALQANPDRKFVYAEMAFFQRWWMEQDDTIRDIVKQQVASGQLGFVNGGYVQNDEAAAHYVAMIDQTTRGHRFLQATFGVTPTVGWQIDPFGHSSTQAAFSALYGFDAQFFGRADYQDMERRKQRKQMELLWRGAESFGSDADVFTGNFASGNYGPPPGFNWDWGQADPQIQDNPTLHDWNVDERVALFEKHCEELFNVTRGDDIMLTMGTDFTYANANTWFKNLDKLIFYVNFKGSYNIFYSTPEAYVAAKHGYNESWPLKTDDFFPYADCPHCYWTGYFTSRPASKGYIRAATSYLQAARQLEVATGRSDEGANCETLEEAISLAQHHDAITGTAKQHVADDYHTRIAAGMDAAESVVKRAISELLQRRRRQRSGAAADTDMPPNAFQQDSEPQVCRLLNISVCEPSVVASRDGKGFSVALYNPVAWKRRHHVLLPVAGDGAWTVMDEEDGALAAQVMPVSTATRRLQDAAAEQDAIAERSAIGDAQLAFAVELPPLGLKLIHVKPAKPSDAHAAAVSRPVSARQLAAAGGSRKGFRLSPEAGAGPELVFSKHGRLRQLRVNGLTTQLTDSLRWYNASDNSDKNIASGAYIFRPNGSYPLDDGTSNPEIIRGPVLFEVRSDYAPWAQLTTRVWTDSHQVEWEWTVGPIPIDDKLGKEIVLRYSTDLHTGSHFSTDANGREMQRRTRDSRPTWHLNNTAEPIASNFYPVTAAIEIEEAGKSTMAVHVDRAQGGTSLKSGEVELMLHRRLLFDDWRGVAEPLNETACGCRDCHCDGLAVRGTHLLTVEEPSKAAEVRRTTQQLLNDPPLLLFLPQIPPPEQAQHLRAAAEYSRQSSNQGAGLELPHNVHLLTAQATSSADVILRLAHLYQVNEHPELSKEATVDLAHVINATSLGRFAETVVETSLSGALPLAEAQQRRLKWVAGQPLRADDRHAKTAAASQPAADAAAPAAEPRRNLLSGAETAEGAVMEVGSSSANSRPGLAALRQGPVGCNGVPECNKAGTLTVTLAAMEIRTFTVHLWDGGPWPPEIAVVASQADELVLLS